MFSHKFCSQLYKRVRNIHHIIDKICPIYVSYIFYINFCSFFHNGDEMESLSRTSNMDAN